jgi:hypothetical protein
MTRSHALPHCPNATLAAERESRGVGRKESGRNKGPAVKPEMGEQAATVPSQRCFRSLSPLPLQESDEFYDSYHDERSAPV